MSVPLVALPSLKVLIALSRAKYVDLSWMARSIVSWVPYKVRYSSSTQQIDLRKWRFIPYSLKIRVCL